MNRPEPCKPSAQRLTAPGVLGAPQTFAFSGHLRPSRSPAPLPSPFGAEILPHAADGERTKASGRGARLGETGGAVGRGRAGRRWAPSAGARAGRLRGFGAGRAGGLQATRGGVRGRLGERDEEAAAGTRWVLAVQSLATLPAP